MSSDIYYTLNCDERLYDQSKSKLSSTSVGFPAPSSNSTRQSQDHSRKTKEKPNSRHCTVRSYVTHCCISLLLLLFSMLLIHATSSIWRDRDRISNIKREFFYVTVALATTSASLNVFSLGVFGIQIHLICTEPLQNKQRMMTYLKKVSTVRFIASFSSLLSIPVSTTGFSCYFYMEFQRTAALIAISIFVFASFGTIGGILFSYLKWRQIQNSVKTEMTCEDRKRDSKAFLTYQNPQFRIEDDFALKKAHPHDNERSSRTLLKKLCSKRMSKKDKNRNQPSSAANQKQTPLPNLPTPDVSTFASIGDVSNELYSTMSGVKQTKKITNISIPPILANRRLQSSASKTPALDQISSSTSTLV